MMHRPPHKLDPTRIEVLRKVRDDLFGAHKEAMDVCNDIARERSKVQEQIKAARDTHRTRFDSGPARGQAMDDLVRKDEALTRRLREQRAAAEACGEKLSAAGSLLESCAEAVGVAV